MRPNGFKADATRARADPTRSWNSRPRSVWSIADRASREAFDRGPRSARVVAQEPTEAVDRLVPIGHAQGAPQTRLDTADDRFPELALQAVEDADRRQSGAAQQHGVGVGRVGLTRQLVRALFGLVVDRAGIAEAPVADDLEPRRLPVGFALLAHALLIRRAERHALDPEMLQRCAHGAGGGHRGRAGERREALDEPGLVREAVGVTRRG